MNVSDSPHRRRSFVAATCLAWMLGGCAGTGPTPDVAPAPVPTPTPTPRPMPAPAPAPRPKPLPSMDTSDAATVAHGRWQGTTQAGKTRSVFTQLILDTTSTLRYGAPLQCTIDLQAEGPNAYAVTDGSGWCGNALAGSLSVSAAADGGVAITLKDAAGTQIGAGTLPLAH